jgi:hypothetical protein
MLLIFLYPAGCRVRRRTSERFSLLGPEKKSPRLVSVGKPGPNDTFGGLVRLCLGLSRLDPSLQRAARRRRRRTRSKLRRPAEPRRHEGSRLMDAQTLTVVPPRRPTAT